MALTTQSGPIRISQINRAYFVSSDAFLNTIQKAVTFAVATGYPGTVIVPQGYTGTDSITAVTGGSSIVYIVDERHGQRQAYLWYNNAYIYESINSRGGLLTPQVNNYAYVGFGVHPTIQEVINGFAALPALTITIIVEPSYTGSEIIGNLVNGDPGIVISDQRTGQWENYIWNGTQFVPAGFGTIIAEEVIVDDSPVRTFANTPDGPGEGMVWPEIGVAVSAGDHWQAPSIDPENIAYLDEANVFTENQTVDIDGVCMNIRANVPIADIDVSHVGSTWSWNADQAAADTSFINVGVPPGTGGFKWYNTWTGGGPNPPTELMILDLDGNLVTRGSVNAYGYSTPQAAISNVQIGLGSDNVTPVIHFTTSLGAGSNQAQADIVSFPGGMQFRFLDDANNANAWLTATRSGATPTGATFNGTVSAPQLSLNNPAAGTSSSVVALQPGMVAGANTNVMVGQSNSVGNVVYYGFNYAGPASPSNVGTIGFIGGARAQFDPAGDWNFAGTITAAGKSFNIPHPTQSDKRLVHGCIEGPEFAVYYRGDGETEDGVATITLPSYFEALTRWEGRTIQITEIYEDEENPEFGNFLAAGRIKDGKFNVRSNNGSVKFYWEVKAIRSDVPKLEVESDKEERGK